jgi:4,5-dihydroxyphthalate decarboxylase
MSAVTIDAVLGNYPHTKALKDGTVSDPEVTFAFTEIEPIHKAFTPMVRTQPYDLSECAVVTYLQAAGYDKPLFLLPAVVASRLQRGCIIYYKPNGVVTACAPTRKRPGCGCARRSLKTTVCRSNG